MNVHTHNFRQRECGALEKLTFAAAVYVIGDLQVGIALTRPLGWVAVAADHPALRRALTPVAELLVSSACVNKHKAKCYYSCNTITIIT
jgi:hypothetical protein